MAEILRGAPVADALTQKLISEVEDLKEKGVIPTLATVRVGERGDDIAYERGATKRSEKIGIDVKHFVLPEDISQDSLISTLNEINIDKNIHGVLLFRPLPKHIDDNIVRNALSPEKDIDGITDASMAGVFTQNALGYPPCTPAACMEVLDFYNIETTGKKAVVIGRSLVVGKPAAMMLIAKNATVTICHTKTSDMPSVCKDADILIVSAGRAGVVDKDYLSKGQTVLDVGINVDDEGKMCGDVNFADAEAMVDNITPVPGGIGTVTSTVLAKHVVEAAKKIIV